MRVESEVLVGGNIAMRALLHTLRNPDRIVGLLLLFGCYSLETYFRNKIGIIEGDFGVFHGVALGGIVSYSCSVVYLSIFINRLCINYQLMQSMASATGGKIHRVYEITESGVKVIETGLGEGFYSWSAMTKPKRVGQYIMMSTVHRELAFEARLIEFEKLLEIRGSQ